jgi:hypothetical protein
LNLLIYLGPDKFEIGAGSPLGRCEKLIFPPIIMNHILKVAYGHKKNNKFDPRWSGSYSSFSSTGRQKYKGFSRIYRGKIFQTRFSIISF